VRQRPITLIRFVITCAVLGVVVSFAFEQASAQDAKTAPAKQYGTQFNPKEYLKEDSRIENVKVELASHPTEAGRSAQWVITPVQIKSGEFVLGVLPAGEYELRFSDVDGHSDATANRGITINSSHVEYDKDRKAAGNADPKHNSDVGRLTMTLTGVVGGTLKQELKADLGSQIGAEVARAGKPKFENILFKADGRSAVKGTLRHDMVKSSIRNLK
jgi:hypothetical protein